MVLNWLGTAYQKLLTDTISYTVSSAAVHANPLAVSPNPARNLLSVRNLNDKANADVKIADMNGYMWLKTVSRLQSFMQIDISCLKAGQYLLTVSDGKELKTTQFVKQ